MIGIGFSPTEQKLPSPVQFQLAGLHARSESLVELSREYERNRVPWEKVKDRLRNEAEDLIRLQEKLGCQILSDGALGWKDQLRPVTESISGLAETTRYSRWYDTNTFYQKPIVTGPVRLGKFEPEKFFQSSLLPRAREWKVSLPGPWTLTELSENKYYSSQKELTDAYALVLREIALKLGTVGVKHVQLSEPSLVYWPYREKGPDESELEHAFDSVNSIVRKTTTKFSVHTFFGDASPIIKNLLDLHVDSIGVDLYETNWESLPNTVTSKTGLTLGIVDSEESLIENPEWIATTAETIREKTGTKTLTLAPNTDLKFVPRTVADQKLASLGKATSILQGGTN